SYTVKVRPSTAFTWPTVLRKYPFTMGKCFLRSFTSRMGLKPLSLMRLPQLLYRLSGVVIKEAPHQVPAAQVGHGGHFYVAQAAHRTRAARVEGAARGDVQRIGHHAADRFQPRGALLPHLGDRAQQRLQVRVPGVF